MQVTHHQRNRTGVPIDQQPHQHGGTDPEARVRLSVVIPAYNEADYLAATLTALGQQDFVGRYEVIVVDNNSTDDTAAVAVRHGARVVHEARPGVCAARQCGSEVASGDIVVSTDADSLQPTGWLTRLEAQFRRSAFPGYDTSLTLGGDEVDFLHRLQRRGPVVWDADNPVLTSSRRMDQGLPHTLVVSFGYYYAWSYLLTRLSLRRQMVPAPAIRREAADLVRRRRWRWRIAGLGAVAAVAVLHRRASRPRTPPRSAT